MLIVHPIVAWSLCRIEEELHSKLEGNPWEMKSMGRNCSLHLFLAVSGLGMHAGHLQENVCPPSGTLTVCLGLGRVVGGALAKLNAPSFPYWQGEPRVSNIVCKPQWCQQPAGTGLVCLTGLPSLCRFLFLTTLTQKCARREFWET